MPSRRASLSRAEGASVRVLRASPKTAQAYFDRLPPHHRVLAEAIRRITLSAAPRIQESLMWSRPWYGTGPGMANAVCYIAAQTHHVNFGFARGASLKDPDGLLEGTGKSMRHVKIRSQGDIRPRLFGWWVRQGVELTRRVKTDTSPRSKQRERAREPERRR